MQLTFRNGTLEDYALMEKFQQEILAFHVKLRPDLFQKADPVISLEKYAEMLGKDQFLFAYAGDEPAGMGILIPQEDLPPNMVPCQILNLDLLCVARKFRHQGVGTAMIEEIKRRARDAGYQSLRLGVIADNRNAYRCYKKNGFITRTYKMECRLDEPNRASETTR